MVKVMRWLTREVVASAAAYAGILIWCSCVMGVVGFPPKALSLLLLTSAPMPILFFMESVFGAVCPRLMERSESGAMFYGFLVYAGFAIIFAKAVHENVYDPSNIGDVILVGLVMGIPSGLMARKCSDAVRDAFE